MARSLRDIVLRRTLLRAGAVAAPCVFASSRTPATQMEQGFDVHITNAIHWGCMCLRATRDSSITRLADLRRFLLPSSRPIVCSPAAPA